MTVRAALSLSQIGAKLPLWIWLVLGVIVGREQGSTVKDWTAWDWLAYVGGIWVPAAFLAVDTAIRQFSKRESFLANSFWGYVPLVLLVMGGILFVGRATGFITTPLTTAATAGSSYAYECMSGWGSESDQKTLSVEADGHCFTGLEDKYYLSAVVFHAFGIVDTYDEPLTGKGGVHEITPSGITIVIMTGPKFLKEFASGAHRSNFFLLLVPTQISMDQFSTIRQAKHLGVIVVAHRGGAPS